MIDKIKEYDIKIENADIIIGIANFSLKTIEDIKNALKSASSSIKFGLTVNDGSFKELRFDGNDEDLIKEAKKIGFLLGGHHFVIVFRNAFPINVLNAIKLVNGVVNIYVATSNPIKLLVYESNNQRMVLGVADGFKPEKEENKEERKEWLKKFGYLD